MTNKTTKEAALAIASGEMQRAVAVAPLFGHFPTLGVDPRSAYLASLAPGSHRAMASALDAMAAWLYPGARPFPWHRIRRVHADALRARLQADYAPATANRFLAALRGVLRVARRLRLIGQEEFDLAIGVESVRGERLPRGRALSNGELRALFGVCSVENPRGLRDAALLALLYGSGLRRAEVVAIDLEHVSADGVVRILGKGNRERLVHLVGGALVALNRWIAARGQDEGPLFMPLTRGNRRRPRRLSAQALFAVLRALAARANVAPFSPHDCRRTFIGDLLDLGVDIATVQKMAGHRDVTTTARYDRRPEQAKRRAAELLHVPVIE